MGATVPASPILRKPRPAGSSQALIVSETMPAYVAPQQELTPIPTMASEPAKQSAPLPAQGRVTEFREVPLRRRRNRYRMQEF